MTSKVCNVCRGTKRTLGMGWIEEDCRTCDGRGRIDVPDIGKVVEAKLAEKKGK